MVVLDEEFPEELFRQIAHRGCENPQRARQLTTALRRRYSSGSGQRRATCVHPAFGRNDGASERRRSPAFECVDPIAASGALDPIDGERQDLQLAAAVSRHGSHRLFHAAARVSPAGRDALADGLGRSAGLDAVPDPQVSLHACVGSELHLPVSGATRAC